MWNMGNLMGLSWSLKKVKLFTKREIGLADMEWNVPNQPDTKFRVGSITKQFTAMLIMQLVEQGKLKSDVPISTYLPDYPKKNGEIITIHHLLTHSSGIPEQTSLPGFTENISRNTYSTRQLVNSNDLTVLEMGTSDFNLPCSSHLMIKVA